MGERIGSAFDTVQHAARSGYAAGLEAESTELWELDCHRTPGEWKGWVEGFLEMGC